MGFIDFYNNFVLNEGFKTHRNVKHKMMSAANKCITALIKGVKNISDVDLHFIIKQMEKYIRYSDMYDGNPEEAEMQYETIRKRIDNLKQKKADLRTMYDYYVLYCAGSKERKVAARRYFPLIESGAVNVFGDEYTIDNVKLVVTKQSRGLRGWWNENTKKICIVLPWLSFPNKNKGKWVDSYGFIEAVYRRLTDEAAFKKFVNYIENDVKGTLSHELTHAWQGFLRAKGTGQEYIGKNEVLLFNTTLPFGNEISNLAYQLSPQEIQARRAEAQKRYRTSGKSYIECWVHSLPYVQSTYKEITKTIWYSNINSRILTMVYFVFCVLPKDPTFQSDLKKHTKKNNEYTGIYKLYMENLKSFEQYKMMGKFSLDDLERAFKNIQNLFSFVKKNSSDEERWKMEDVKQTIQQEFDSTGNALVDAFSFWADDAAVQRFKNEVKQRERRLVNAKKAEK